MDKGLDKNADITVVLVFFVLIAILGVLSAGFVVNDYARSRSSASWPVVQGIVLSRVDGQSARVRYAYSIDGRSYESRRERTFTARFNKPAREDFSAGEEIDVFVDPGNHRFSVLEPGGSGAVFFFFCLISGICVFVGFGGVVWTLGQGAAQGAALQGQAGY